MAPTATLYPALSAVTEPWHSRWLLLRCRLAATTSGAGSEHRDMIPGPYLCFTCPA